MIGSVLTFIVVLSVLVLVHEFGHFIMAKKSGIWVEEFGFGIPPRAYGKKFGETIYSINWLPFGGFVRLHGENTEDTVTDPKRAFLNKNKWTRSKIILAGVVMNFLLAIAIFSVSYSISGIPRNTGEVKIVESLEGSPAKEMGLESGDIAVSVDGQKISTNDEFIDLVEEKKGNEISLEVKKVDSGELSTLQIVPRENPPEGEGSLGVVISSSEFYYPPLWQRPFYGAYYGVKEAIFWGGVVITGFLSIFRDLFGGTVPKEVAGPVGIYALTSEAASFGFLTLINFVGILSVNLAILNVIPFPALDGGRLLFILIEGVLGKRVVPKVEAVIHTVGMVILIILIVAITYHDIANLISFGGVTGYINSVIK